LKPVSVQLLKRCGACRNRTTTSLANWEPAMSHRSQPEGWVKRWCDLLGRQNALSGFLDWIARWIVPPPRLAFSGVGAAPTAQGASELPDQSPEHPGPQIVMMDDSLRGTRWGKGDDNPGGHGPPAPPKPWHEHGYPDPTSGPTPPAAFIAESKKKCNYY